MRRSIRDKLPYVLLILTKMALVWPLPMTALPTYGYDEELFVSLADHLAQGKWLGPYGPITLAKGPGYPMFIAAGFRMGITLAHTHQALYIAFCVAFVVAWAPVIKNPWGRLLLFTVLLFNPISCQISTFANANREGVYPAMTGLVFAGAIGMIVRYRRPVWKIVLWALGLGFALGYFWITREEGVWVVPSLVLIVSSGAVALVRERAADWIKRLSVMVLIPTGVCILMVCAVCEINRRAYGEFIEVEFKDSAYLAAYGALARIEPAKFQRFVPVTKETRLRAYAVSPTFAKLKPFLEGDLGRRWEGSTTDFYRDIHGEMAGGWFMWALRESITAAGYGNGAKVGHDFFAQMAKEINAACDDGRLRAGPRRDTMMPAWRWDYLKPTISAAEDGVVILVRLPGLRAHIAPSLGTVAERTEYSLMIGQPITAGRDGSFGQSLHPPPPDVVERLNGIARILWFYRHVVPTWTILALAIFIAASVAMLKKYRSWLWVAGTALLGAMILRIILLAYIDTASFGAINLLYLSCCVQLLLAFNVLMTIEAAGFLRRRWTTRRYPSKTASTAA